MISEFIHAATVNPADFDFSQPVCDPDGEPVLFIADGYAEIHDVDMNGDIDEFPIQIVAIITVGGWKAYWGTNRQHPEMIYRQGIKLTNESVARSYFPFIPEERKFGK